MSRHIYLKKLKLNLLISSDLIGSLQDDLSTFQNWMKSNVIVALDTIQQGVNGIKTSNETSEQSAFVP